MEKSQLNLRAGLVIVIIAVAAFTYVSLNAVSRPTPGTAQPTTDAGDALFPGAETMPAGDQPGWRQVFAEDFNDGNVPIGAFPGPVYGTRWSENYFDGTPDTAGQQRKTNSGYYPSKVLSVHNGVLDMYLHTEDGVSMGAAPAPKLEKTSERPFNSQLYGRYSVRFRADALEGFKVAWLLWPDSEQWPQDGEIDFPEGDLAGFLFAAMHGTDPSGKAIDMFQTQSSFTSWHTATTEWSPGRVEFFLDGRSIGVSTSATPNKPMHYVLQTESCLPVCPLPETSGHVYVDWVAIWAKS